VLESLLGSDAALRIIDKDPLEQIEELSVEAVICGDELLGACVSNMLIERGQFEASYSELFHGFHVFA